MTACGRCGATATAQACPDGHLFTGMYCSHMRTSCPRCGKLGEPVKREAALKRRVDEQLERERESVISVVAEHSWPRDDEKEPR